MEYPWANSTRSHGGIAGADLHLEVTRPGVRAGLEQALREAVRSGRLLPGTRLPSSRSLASDLGIARNTVAEVYGQLVAEGWLTARQGSGTRVADRMMEPSPPPPSPPPAETPRIGHDLTPGSPDLASFPRTEWLAAARRALTAVPDQAFGYGDPRGRPELRHALAEYLARARGVRTTPDRIVVCSGFVQGLALMSGILRDRGATTVAVESFGLGIHRDIISGAGLRTIPLDVDEAGARVGELPASGANAALVTAAHQFPIGVALAPARRMEAVEWAAATGGSIIEDDYDGEFRYERPPVGALQGLDPTHVVYLGTASKSLAPGVRLGWMVLPEALLDAAVAAKNLADLQTGSLEQLTLAELITSGRYDRHVRRSRLRYRRRRDRLVSALAERVPQVRVTGISAGLHALVELPGSIEVEGRVIAAAAERGLALNGLTRYRHAAAGEAQPALVVGYGTPPDHAFRGALGLFCDTLAAELA